MKKLILASAILGASLLPLTASAGAYVEGNIGYTQLDTNKNINATDNSIGHLSGGARVGYDQIVADNLKLGAEVGLDDLGQSTFGNLLTVKQQSVDLLATATVALSEQVDVFAKGGITNIQQKVTTPAVTDNKVNKIEPKLVVGAAYNVNDNVAVTGNVAHVFADELQAGDNFLDKRVASSTGANVGLRIKF
jgi:hypothetical protein